MTRIQNLMSQDALYINKAEEIQKKQHNQDLLGTSLSGLNETQKFTLMNPPAATTGGAASAAATKPAASESTAASKGTLVSIPVVIKNVEMLSYVMRISEKMPVFNYWPRGLEIVHRLIMRAAMSDSLEDFQLYRTDESVLESLIFRS